MNLTNRRAAIAFQSWWEAFTLKDVERRAAGVPEAVRNPARRWVRAARERLAAAQDLVDAHAASAVVLYRQAALCYLTALLTSRSAAPDAGERLTTDELLARARQVLARDGETSFDDGKLARFFKMAGGDDRPADIATIDRLDGQGAAEIVALGQESIDALAALIEIRAPSELRFERAVRLGVAGAFLLLVVLLAVGALLDSGNIALHKPTTASSVFSRVVLPPGGLTDGITTGSFGIHTEIEAFPWVQVDLQSVFKLSRIAVYNRGDAVFDAGLPFTLQLSEDGKNYVDIATRTTSFGQWIPWTVFCHGRKARYVRIHSVAGKFVALSELKVFGSPP